MAVKSIEDTDKGFHKKKNIYVLLIVMILLNI